jgi:CheY-like chemotaxis protein
MSLNILLIEDNCGDIDLLTECLAEVQPHNCLHTFRAGQPALDFLRQGKIEGSPPKPDLVLLDLNLPILGGKEILAQIKTDPDLRHIPVVVFTSSSSDQDIKQCYQLHANSYIVKPNTLEQYLKIVESICDYWCGTVTHG